MTAEDHIRFMRAALDLARSALDREEFPVGCILVYEGRIIARGQRGGTRQTVPSELDHAEMLALRELEARSDPIDRGRITLYCSLEPCLMCFGALLINGIRRIVYAYEDAMGGGTACDRSRLAHLYRNARVDILGGICRQESLDLFKRYFARPDMDYWRGSLLAQYTLAQP